MTEERGSLGWIGVSLIGCSAFIMVNAVIGFVTVVVGIVGMVHR